MPRPTITLAAPLAVAFATAGTLPPDARAQEIGRDRVGVWNVSAHQRDGGFSHCAMSTSAAHGSRILIFYVARSRFQVAMMDRSWSFARGARFTGYYQLDGGARVPVQGASVLSTSINFSIAADRMVFAQFRVATSLRLAVDGASEYLADFAVGNSAAAFDRLYACAQAGMARTAPGGPRDQQVESPDSAPARPPAARQPTSPGVPARPPSGRQSDSADSAIGTGFHVSAAGHILTAAHVIRGCKTIRVQPIGDVAEKAAVIAKSESDDLALLKSERKRKPAPFRAGPLRLGEQIVLFGFPLPGSLASSGNLTTGNISALAGLKDDHRMMQVSAPAQPGNSGGPVFDLRGRVTGVLVSSVNALRVARTTGALPQNVNFAVKSSVVLGFLEAHGVGVELDAPAADLSVADVAERARASTVRIECLNQ